MAPATRWHPLEGGTPTTVSSCLAAATARGAIAAFWTSCQLRCIYGFTSAHPDSKLAPAASHFTDIRWVYRSFFCSTHPWQFQVYPIPVSIPWSRLKITAHQQPSLRPRQSRPYNCRHQYVGSSEPPPIDSFVKSLDCALAAAFITPFTPLRPSNDATRFHQL